MTQHLGFRVIGRPPAYPRDFQSENFEVRQASIDCAQYLESKGWTDIRCVQVTSRVKQFESDPAEQFTDIEWQCHPVGSLV